MSLDNPLKNRKPRVGRAELPKNKPVPAGPMGSDEKRQTVFVDGEELWLKATIQGLSYIKSGATPTSRKSFVQVKFEASDGSGRIVDLTLWPDPRDPKFRSQVEALTGISLSRGGTVTLADVEDALANNQFLCKIGNQRGYDVVKYIKDRKPR